MGKAAQTRKGVATQALPMTLEHNEILKKATAHVDSPLSTIKANNDVNAYLCASSGTLTVA